MSRIDNEYIERIYRETSSYLIKYVAIKCRRTEDIQDILQNTYLGFIDTVSRNGLSGILSPKYYLLRIAKREIAKYYERENQKNRNIIASIDDEDYVETCQEDFLDRQFTGEEGFSVELWDRIKSFGDVTAKIFTLRFVYDMTLEKIAKELHITPSATKNYLYRALKVLKKEMNSEYGSVEQETINESETAL